MWMLFRHLHAWVFCLALSLLPASLAAAQTPIDTKKAPGSFEPDLLIVEMKITGLERTNRVWLESYIGLSLPERLSRPEIIRIQRKLLTTGVFSDVKIAVEPTTDRLDAFTLYFQIVEKWTTIPVIRGVYGGGTPLSVVGVYDIHAFGRLLTFGGEMRKYGDAPPGFIFYGRDPRNSGGRNYIGAEYWREFRSRQVFDEDGEETGILGTDTSLVRISANTPFSQNRSIKAQFSWRYGLDLEIMREKPPSFDPEDKYVRSGVLPDAMGAMTESKRQTRMLATLVYDDVEINQIELNGQRAKFRVGPNISAGRNHSLAEFEGFYYLLTGGGFNVASHLFLGQSTLATPSTQYYLGGFDSIRGLPDGIIYGTRSAYVNVEFRKVTSKRKYLWLQPVLFSDVGNAGNAWSEVSENVRSSAGIGVRLSVPQVYRLIFRIDYAVSTDGSGSRGITAGMNQFFDPYRPL